MLCSLRVRWITPPSPRLHLSRLCVNYFVSFTSSYYLWFPNWTRLMLSEKWCRLVFRPVESRSFALKGLVNVFNVPKKIKTGFWPWHLPSIGNYAFLRSVCLWSLNRHNATRWESISSKRDLAGNGWTRDDFHVAKSVLESQWELRNPEYRELGILGSWLPGLVLLRKVVLRSRGCWFEKRFLAPAELGI